MNIKLIVATLMLSFGMSTTHATQLQPQMPLKKEASIIKSVAAALKEEQIAQSANNYTTLDQLIKTNQQTKTTQRSKEENLALASIGSTQNILIPRTKKFSNFIQSLFGG